MSLTLKTMVSLFEKSLIEKQLEASRWNVTQTAKYFGLARSSLHRKMKEFGIKGSQPRSGTTSCPGAGPTPVPAAELAPDAAEAGPA